MSNAGEMSFADDVPGATSDLVGLRAFDSNNDGRLSDEDERFADFSIWNDRDGDGEAKADEIYSLEEAGIAFLTLSADSVDAEYQLGQVAIVGVGAYARTNGQVMDFYDAALTYWA